MEECRPNNPVFFLIFTRVSMQILSGIKHHIFLSMVWKLRQQPCCCVYQKVSNRILPMLSDTEFVPNCHGVITLDTNIIHLEELADEK